MSVFEMIMLICFGIAWPFSIWKSYTSNHNEGKSLIFLFIVFIGYLAGIAHKVLFNPDIVTFLYILNTMMVAIDIALFFRNNLINKGHSDGVEIFPKE